MSGSLSNYTRYGDINVTINNNDKNKKRDSSTESDSSISSCEVKRRRTINYFSGEGKKEWQPKKELVINNINITKAFQKFRKQSIKEAERGNELNSLRILSLSHIFPINKLDSEKSISRHLKNDEAKSFKELIRNMEPKLPRAPNQAIIYCKDIVDGVDEEKQVENKEDKEDEEDEENMMSMVRDLSEHTIKAKAKIAKSSEATFGDKFIMPAIRRVLLSNARDEIVYAIIDKADRNKKKPDLMIGTELKKKDYYFFFVEEKRPSAQSKYQVEDDYVKLLKQMKGSIDQQLRLGIENPLSLGLLVEGFKCTLFQMVLLTDGIYSPFVIKRFWLVEGIYELINLPSVVEVLMFVKLELYKFVDEVGKKRKRGEKMMMKERVYPSFNTTFVNK